ncbi:MAG: glycerol-3-phosphate acyltransferase [Actinomycetota bacterium]
MAENIYFKIAYVLASYLLGSVLFGYIIAKMLKGGDLSRIDRPGTAGAGRQFGYKAGIPTFIFDVGKGVLVPLLARLIGLDDVTMVIAAAAVLIGHNWPVFFKFRGGGGIATTIGIAAYLIPVIFLIAFGISLTVGFGYKYTLGKKHKVNPNVVGSALGSFLLPLLCYLFGQPLHITLLFICIFLIILIKGLILHFMYRNVPTAN